MDVLLTEGSERATLAAGRSLVRSGLDVGVAQSREEIWRWRDPAPFLVESLQQLGLTR